jgi:hypothetical protein
MRLCVDWLIITIELLAWLHVDTSQILFLGTSSVNTDQKMFIRLHGARLCLSSILHCKHSAHCAVDMCCLNDVVPLMVCLLLEFRTSHILWVWLMVMKVEHSQLSCTQSRMSGFRIQSYPLIRPSKKHTNHGHISGMAFGEGDKIVCCTTVGWQKWRFLRGWPVMRGAL